MTRKYGRVIIVFDGYNDKMSTKQMTHQRRSSGKVGATVMFDQDMKITMKKDVFLSNVKNKEQFLALNRRLCQHQCVTHHADGDADLLIVQTAVEVARTRSTILVGDDTDLLVLLLFHADAEVHDLFFITEAKNNSLRRRIWNI